MVNPSIYVEDTASILPLIRGFRKMVFPLVMYAVLCNLPFGKKSGLFSKCITKYKEEEQPTCQWYRNYSSQKRTFLFAGAKLNMTSGMT